MDEDGTKEIKRRKKWQDEHRDKKGGWKWKANIISYRIERWWWWFGYYYCIRIAPIQCSLWYTKAHKEEREIERQLYSNISSWSSFYMVEWYDHNISYHISGWIIIACTHFLQFFLLFPAKVHFLVETKREERDMLL